MKKNTGIVCIHGAGLGSFIWDDVKPLLNYPVLCADFPNRNGGKSINSGLNLADYSDSIIKEAESWGMENLIIVGLSIGAIVGLKVAAHFGKRTAGFIAIGAAIPENGNSFVSCLPFPKNIVMRLLLHVAGTKPPRSAIITGLCNDIDPEMTEMIVNRFTPEAKSLYLDKCNCEIPETHTLFVTLQNDQEFPVSLQHQMAKNLKAASIRSLDCGHLPMMSKPVQLAEIINEFTDEATN